MKTLLCILFPPVGVAMKGHGAGQIIFVGGIKNLIRTNGEYDSNDDLFVSMGNAALNGSSFGILPW